MISYEPIGVIRSPYTKPDDTPRNYTQAGDTAAVLEVDGKYTDAMADMHAGEQYIVLFHMDRAKPCQLKVHKYRNGPVTGLFSTRAPFRPNPIGLSVITIQRIDGNRITFTGADMFDGTQVLDIKPVLHA